MPIKKSKPHHRVPRESRKRNKHFLKVYAPYIPLLFLIGLNVFFASNVLSPAKNNDVLAYATSISRQELLAETNEERQSTGEPALKLNPELSEAAQLKARDMSANGYWSHTSPEGKEPWYFIESAGYKYSKAAENLAYGFDSSSSVVSGWMNSPEHKANIIDSSLRDVGFGIVNIPDYQNSGPQTLVVAMYGRAAPSGAFSPASTLGQNTAPAKISFAQSLTDGKTPWINLIIGLSLGASIMYLITKHLRSIRRALVSSEKFVIKHPILDATVLALAVLAAILSRTAGFIQ